MRCNLWPRLSEYNKDCGQGELLTQTATEKMKKSQSVPAVLLASVAATIIASGCRAPVKEVRRCVDANGVVLDDKECDTTTSGTRHYGGHVYPHWVYGGSGGNTIGSRAMGFRSTPSDGAHVVSSSGRTISRGGFGSSSSGRGFSFGG